MSITLGIIAFFFVVAIALGLLARRGRVMSLEQWSVGGRGFNTMFVFLLIAGEFYTTFTFLGGSGWAYGRGAPAFYILAYAAVSFSYSYFLLPIIWRYAGEKRLVSQADYFVSKYESKALGVIVALVSVAALLPYLVLQLKGLGIIVSEASNGVVTPAVAVWTGTAALVGYVVVSGVRGSAWTSALKDAMILTVVVGIGVYLPFHYYGGIHQMFVAIDHAKPGFLTLSSRGASPAWFISTVFLNAIGVYMWPQYFAGAYTARNEDVFRKNAVIMPLYQLMVLFVFFVGFAAILVVPGLKGADADLSLLRIVKATFAPWVVGMIGAAGLLTALVPGSMILITAATILAQNVYRPLAREASDATISLLARWLVPFLALVAVIFTLRGGGGIVLLLLMGYNVVTQLFPAFMLSLTRRPLVSVAAATAGLVAGELVVVVLTVSGASIATMMPRAPQVVKDLNVGLVALTVNVVVLAVVAGVQLLRLPPRAIEPQHVTNDDASSRCADLRPA